VLREFEVSKVAPRQAHAVPSAQDLIMASKNGPKRPRKPSGPGLALPDGKSEDIAPDDLLLDPGNLRLFEVSAGLASTSAKLVGQQPIQDRVYKTIVETPRFDVQSLVTSILYNGFLKHERLIVAPYDHARYLVLEGNRRLASVRYILRKAKEQPRDLPPTASHALQTITTLPCFVLDGPVIDGDEEVLQTYRRAAEIYIGMRHLMGAKSWEPASRYEFQARLISEGWTPEQLAERFGRDKGQILRELKGQRLYSDFVEYEKKQKLAHSLTYNAFSEAGRAPAIMNWLGWSAKDMRVTNKENERTFFTYLISRLRHAQTTDEEANEGSLEESAEGIIRRLREMLRLEDEDIVGALEDGEFEVAENLYETRKEGELAKRLGGYIRALKRVTIDEAQRDAKENRRLLRDLITQAENIEKMLAPRK
jgi:hypothetical protein